MPDGSGKTSTELLTELQSVSSVRQVDTRRVEERGCACASGRAARLTGI